MPDDVCAEEADVHAMSASRYREGVRTAMSSFNFCDLKWQDGPHDLLQARISLTVNIYQIQRRAEDSSSRWLFSGLSSVLLGGIGKLCDIERCHKEFAMRADWTAGSAVFRAAEPIQPQSLAGEQIKIIYISIACRVMAMQLHRCFPRIGSQCSLAIPTWPVQSAQFRCISAQLRNPPRVDVDRRVMLGFLHPELAFVASFGCGLKHDMTTIRCGRIAE